MGEAVAMLARSRLAIIEQIVRPLHPPGRGGRPGRFARMTGAARSWWRYHPAHLVLDVAAPLLLKYIGRSPRLLPATHARSHGR